MELQAWSWRVVVLTFLGTLAISSTWALSSPLMLVPDEASHTIRAVSLWQGDILGRRYAITNPGPPPAQAVNFEVHLPNGYRGIGDQTACYDNGLRPAGCAPPLAPAEGEFLIGTSAGAYQPLWYVLQGAPSVILSPTQAIYAGRLLQALAGSVFFALTAGLAAALAGRPGMIATVLGITPTAVWILGSINPNGVEIAAASTLWLALLALTRVPQHRGVAWLVGVAAFGMAWARPFSPFIAVGIVATVAVLVLDRAAIRRMWAAGSARLALGATALAVTTSLVWVFWSGALQTFIRVPNPTLTPGVAASQSFDLTEHRLEQMIGRFGLINIPLPQPSVWVWTVAVIVVLLIGLWWGTWRHRLVLLALLGATVALPVLAEATTAAEYGFTWQGRYTLPVAFGALATCVWIFGTPRRPLPSIVSGPVAVIFLGVTIGVGHVVGYLQTMQRVSVGDGNPLLAYLSQPGFSPPGPDLGLLLAVGAGVMGLTAGVAMAGVATAGVATAGRQEHSAGAPGIGDRDTTVPAKRS